MTPHSTERGALSPSLDAIRWIAALTVMVAHLDARLIKPETVFSMQAPADHLSLLGHYGWIFFVGFAHKAVMVFFVMSGWLVGGKVLKQVLEHGELDLGRYYLDRLSRLWIVLLPALALTYLLDDMGSAMAAGQEIYVSFEPNRTPAALACNAFFLQMVRCHELGSNVALWSLANEFWYYVLWPLLLAPLAKRWSPGRRWTLFSLGCALAALLAFQRYGDYQVLPYFAIWAVGAAARLLSAPLVKSPLHALVVLAAVLFAARIGDGTQLVSITGWFLVTDLCVALSLANLLVSLAHWNGAVPRVLELPMNRFLADRSYSLYAVHVPIIMIVCALLQSRFGLGWQMSRFESTTWLLLPCIAIFTWLCTALFAQVTEMRTAAIKRWLTSIIPRPRLPAATDPDTRA
ncbi:acyltransferase family protein [Peristeroidobacter soli]|uniref:acyltransferase family protein n=1 Tax=Peristeroidobacter soli TaxID=2497877 RepID=UPI00101DB627|nr:acyltransferase [Peristeroidobacter soli]